MNILILSAAGFIAWLGTKLFEYSEKKALRAERKKRIRAYYNGSLYAKKCQKVQDKIEGYYFDFAQTDPVALAHFLAEREIGGIKSQRRVDFLYKQIENL